MKLFPSLLAILVLCSCARRPVTIEFNVPVACVRKVVMRGCDPRSKPLHCEKIAVTYIENCEQPVVNSLPSVLP